MPTSKHSGPSSSRTEPRDPAGGDRGARLDRFFGSLEAKTRRELEAMVEWRTIESGETLFRQGDVAGDAYFVASGRLRVVVTTGAGEQILNEIGPGEMLGEMALLTGEKRSATVYAVRDSDLARISRASFDRLIAKSPQAMVHISRIMAERLRYKSSAATDTLPATVALVPAGPGVPLDDFARRLERALAVHGTVDLLTAATVDAALGETGTGGDAAAEARLRRWLDRREASRRFVLYQGDADVSPWTDRCVRQADHLLVVADAGADPAPGEIETRIATRSERSARRSLVLLQRGEPSGTAGWLAGRDLAGHFHLRPDRDDDFARLARHLTGKAVGLVLGGGGARGAAHIGVFRALAERGITVDLIGGTSMGAVMAGFYAMGQQPEDMVETCRRCFGSLKDYTLPVVALLAGRRIDDECRAIFGERRIEDLWLPFFAVSTNLTRAEQVIHRDGRLRDALRASIALPGILPPVQRDGDVLADGGLLNNVPVDVMRRLCGGGTVIAVDVSPAVELRAAPGSTPARSGWKLLWRRLDPFRRRSASKDAPASPGIMEILQRASQVSSVASRNRSKALADLYLDLPVTGWSLLEFEAAEGIAAHGYRLASERLASWSARASTSADPGG